MHSGTKPLRLSLESSRWRIVNFGLFAWLSVSHSIFLLVATGRARCIYTRSPGRMAPSSGTLLLPRVRRAQGLLVQRFSPAHPVDPWRSCRTPDVHARCAVWPSPRTCAAWCVRQRTRLCLCGTFVRCHRRLASYVSY